MGDVATVHKNKLFPASYGLFIDMLLGERHTFTEALLQHYSSQLKCVHLVLRQRMVAE